ncbi:MAG: alkaline phosphatase D family protein, partial [Planctomycetota bacterium]
MIRALFLSSFFVSSLSFAAGPYQASGFKVGEVSSRTAIVWTRLTAEAARRSDDAPMLKVHYAKSTETKRRLRTVERLEFPNGGGVADLPGAVAGATGDVRVRYRVVGATDWRASDWRPVLPSEDFTRQFFLESLRSDARYEVLVEARASSGTSVSSVRDGFFRTAPSPDSSSPVLFTVSTGQAYKDRDNQVGYRIYDSMLKLDPSFFVHTGDIVYYDTYGKTSDLARYHWQRTYSLPSNVAFHRRVGSYFIKDDHDTWVNDCWPSMKSPYMYQLSFEAGLGIFREQVPMGESTYRTKRWGKHLQVWMVEGRDFRSANTAPDGPEKTIWGQRQKDWLRRSMSTSSATFRVLISPTPIVGPDRKNKKDNHSNSVFAHEGKEVREFLKSLENCIVICGDRHWQYYSVHPEVGLHE